MTGSRVCSFTYPGVALAAVHGCTAVHPRGRRERDPGRSSQSLGLEARDHIVLWLGTGSSYAYPIF
jgi:hypothetical protein